MPSSARKNVVVATFTAPGNPPPGNHEDPPHSTPTIAWVNGTTSAGTIVNNVDGTFAVLGPHSFPTRRSSDLNGESEGATTISVTVSHDATAPQTVTDAVNV